MLSENRLRRSMRKFANLFLILFLADGVFSLMDEMLRTFLHFGFLALPRNFVAFATILISVALFIALGIDRRLPKRILLLPLLFVFWGVTGLWPLLAIMGSKYSGLVAAALQVALGAAAMLYIRKINAQSLLLTEAMFNPPVFSLRNTLIFATVNLLLLPPALVFFGFASTSTYIEKKTSGFVHLGLDGLYMKEKVYRKSDKTILLTSMIHIAEKSYYDTLMGATTLDRTIILMEGVSDKHHLLKNRFSYEKFADLLGLVSQENLRFKGRFIEQDELLEPEEPQNPDQAPHIVRADIDISHFEPQTIAFLNALGKYLFNNKSFTKGVLLYNQWVKENLPGDKMQNIFKDILDKRNSEVIRFMNQALPKYDTIVIPWGALHMPGIEAAVRAEGFKLQKTSQRRSIDFRKLPYDRIINGLRKLVLETAWGNASNPLRFAG